MQEIWGEKEREKEREVTRREKKEKAYNRHHVTNDGTYKRAATALLRKWFVYYIVVLRSQANRR